ncbi:MAG TPA: hypothetical protein VFC73_02435 [Syntrophomonadaceae bacterium]|nr:hypothetical protein [Syntrophomonadaceae bacterium]
MHKQKGKIVKKNEFLKDGEFSKEEYEGLLVASDTQTGIYNIGIELGEDKILVIDQADDNNVHEKYHELIPKIQEIQRQYGVENDISSYTKS